MIVADASVIYKWIIDEDSSETVLARKLLENFLLKKEEVIAPDIILYELANILSFKTGLDKRDIKKAWKQFKRLALPVSSPTMSSIEKSMNFSRKFKVSVYDASYAVLAREKKCKIVTADSKFVAQVNLPFVKDLKNYPLAT